jgi:hypothetical protein
MSEKLKLAFVDPRLLIKNSWNPNKMSPEAEAKLRNSLQKHGHIRPILVRELESGQLEIVGGEHRTELSIELGMTEVPVMNLGRVSDETAKRALMIDNSRYGEDDAGLLSELLSGLGTADELAEWMNMDTDQLSSLLGADGLGSHDELIGSLDGLDELSDDDELPAPTREIKTHQPMKFKVPVEDAEFIKDTIDGVIKAQGIEDSDSSIRAGEALLWLCRNYSAGEGVSGGYEGAPAIDVSDDAFLRELGLDLDLDPEDDE